MATQNKTFYGLNAATTGITAGALDLLKGGAGLDVSMADKISIQCLNTASVTGVTTFTVQVSNDDRNYVDYNRMVTNIAAGVSTSTTTTPYYTNRLVLSSAVTSGVFFFPERDYFKSVRVIATKGQQTTTSGGVFTATLQARD